MKRLLRQVSRGPTNTGSRRSSDDDLDSEDASTRQIFQNLNGVWNDVSFLGELDDLAIATPPVTNTAVIPNLDLILISFEERVVTKTHRYHFKACRHNTEFHLGEVGRQLEQYCSFVACRVRNPGSDVGWSMLRFVFRALDSNTRDGPCSFSNRGWSRDPLRNRIFLLHVFGVTKEEEKACCIGQWRTDCAGL